MANHVRWCDKNPKYIEYRKNNTGVEAMWKTHSDKDRPTNQFDNARKQGLVIPDSPNKGKKGIGAGWKHTEQSKEVIKKKALSSNHRRLRRKMIEYNGIMLDSTWELELAKQLDILEISWIRPKPIKWIDDDGLSHNYFADFYLTDYDLYIDPKNPHAQNVQAEKIKCLRRQLTNLIILSSLKEIKEFAPVLAPVSTR